MSESSQSPPLTPAQTAYLEGRRAGLATAALALSVVAFLNLLGIEKSLLAVCLAILALRGMGPSEGAARYGRAALIIAIIHVVTFFAVIAAFHDKLIDLIHQLQKLG